MPHTDRFLQIKRLTLFRLLFISVLFLFIHQILPLMERGMRLLPGDPLHLFVAGLFFITLIYLFWLRTRWHLDLLARVQCAMDPLLSFILITLTGGLRSPFYFFFTLSVLSATLLLGRRDAMVVGILSLILSLLSNSVIDHLFHNGEPYDANLASWLVLQGSAFFLTALLAGTLSERARGLQQAVEHHRENLASMVLLNRQIIEAVPFGLLTLNSQGLIRSVNQVAADILNRAPESLTGRYLDRILPDFRWILENPVAETIHVEMSLNDRILDVSLSPLVDSQQAQVGILVVLRDLTQQKQLEKEIAEGERLALTGRMAAFMAHEIRNPLASILSAVQMLGTTHDESRRERMQRIVLEEVTRLNRLTSDFLTFSRPRQPQRQWLPLAVIVEEIYLQLVNDERWGEHRNLTWQLPNDIEVCFDPNQLRQVLLNLLLNSAQFTHDHGEVTILAEATSHGVTVVVMDNGTGIDAELLPKVMEPFFTTRTSGTGLGLALVGQLVRSNGGQLSLANRPEGGLQVTLFLEGRHGDHSDM
ncbi:MAG: PAS domain-containing protein [Magnetococcales bacterium]|nr:PAS domain-containing protein [Magnetococcales bacterium]NGZ26081.1 PAS domain-containing protein [Magnetococcales bacterium]